MDWCIVNQPVGEETLDSSRRWCHCRRAWNRFRLEHLSCRQMFSLRDFLFPLCRSLAHGHKHNQPRFFFSWFFFVVELGFNFISTWAHTVIGCMLDLKHDSWVTFTVFLMILMFRLMKPRMPVWIKCTCMTTTLYLSFKITLTSQNCIFFLNIVLKYSKHYFPLVKFPLSNDPRPVHFVISALNQTYC